MADNHDSIVTGNNAGHVSESVNGMVSLTTLPAVGNVVPVTANPAVRLDVQLPVSDGAES